MLYNWFVSSGPSTTEKLTAHLHAKKDLKGKRGAAPLAAAAKYIPEKTAGGPYRADVRAMHAQTSKMPENPPGDSVGKSERSCHRGPPATCNEETPSGRCAEGNGKQQKAELNVLAHAAGNAGNFTGWLTTAS